MFESWGDFWSGLKDLGEGEVESRVQQQYGGDHIAAQNAAGQELATVLARFNNTKPHTDAEYQAFEQDIDFIARRFAQTAATFQTARATRGAAELTALARQIISDAEAERQGSQRYPGGYTGGGSINLAGFDIPTWAIALGGVALIYKLGKRRSYPRRRRK